ncbi:MAG: hypothetical protein FWD57_12655, partial [Polyangiaceae bacterium]|nr:hypothetical protein [Polyangiaceae bacterium]
PSNSATNASCTPDSPKERETATDDFAVGLRDLVSDNLSKIDARAINSTHLGDDPEGTPIYVRVGKFGPYLHCGEATASIPDGLTPDELNTEKAMALIEEAGTERKLGSDPVTGLDVWFRMGRFGAYVQLGETDPDGATKPKRASLFRSMEPDSLTLQQALALLSLPRVVGTSDGEPIEAYHGRYGPFVMKGKERRSLDSEEQVFSITLPEAIELFAQPIRQTRTRSSEPLRELGEDPTTNEKITVREGRFGPYVTDGQTNASLPKTETIAEITTERAIELLAARREKLAAAPPPPRKALTKAGAKKAATKKAAAKKAAAKKTAAKKAAAKKAAGKKASDKKAAKKATKSAKKDANKAGEKATAKKAVKKAAKKSVDKAVETEPGHADAEKSGPGKIEKKTAKKTAKKSAAKAVEKAAKEAEKKSGTKASAKSAMSTPTDASGATPKE